MSSCVQGLMGGLAFDESPSSGKGFDRRNRGKGVSAGAPAACRAVENAGRQRGPHRVRSSWRPHVSHASSRHPPRLVLCGRPTALRSAATKPLGAPSVTATTSSPARQLCHQGHLTHRSPLLISKMQWTRLSRRCVVSGAWRSLHCLGRRKH